MLKLEKFIPFLIILFMGLVGLTIITIVLSGNFFQRFADSPSQTTSTAITKSQICPDNWYKNEQPCVYKDSPTECKQQRKEYFIIKGERKEVEEVDVEWVKKNCEINKPEFVY